MTIINMSGGRAGAQPVYQSRTVTPQAFPLTVQPQQGYDALSQVTVNAPANLLAQNIRKDVSIAGVVGTYEATAPTIKLQQKTVVPSASSQTVKPDSGYDGLSQVTVAGAPNLTAGNIKSGVNIFGVVGTYEGVAPNPSTATNDYSSSVSTFSSYPKILVGSTMNVQELNIPVNVQNFCTTGNVIESSWQSGYFLDAVGGSCVWSNLYPAGGDFGDTVYGIQPTSWTNTNRDSTSMDNFLDTVSRRLGEDYFSGTLSCYVGALVIDKSGNIHESCPFSSGNSSNSTGSPSPTRYYTRDVPFTYSNGNVTYTLSTGSTGALGVRPNNYVWGNAGFWAGPTDFTIRRCLFFHQLHIEV